MLEGGEKYGRAGEVETYARCGRRATSLGETNGQGRDEEAGDGELHICRAWFCNTVALY